MDNGGISLDKRYNIFKLTWPIFIEQLLRMTLGNVNVLMLSRFSDDAVAAVGVSNRMIGVLMMAYGIISLGTSVTISQSIGAEDRARAIKSSSTALVSNLFIGILSSILIILIAKPFALLMGLKEELFEYSRTYVLIVGGGSFLQALIATMSAIMRSFGFSREPMLVSFGINIFNIIGNWLVIFQPFGIPSTGVTGVAVSRLISDLAGLVMLTIMLFNNKEIGFPLKFFRDFEWKTAMNILNIGIPSAVEYISYSTSQLVITGLINALGKEPLTAMVYVSNVTTFVYVVSLSLGQGTQIQVGYLKGAGKFEEANQRVKKSLRLALAINLSISILFAVLGKHLIGLYTTNQVIINIAATVLISDTILEPGRAMNHILGSSLKGVGDVRIPAIAGIVSMWLISVFGSYIAIAAGAGLLAIWLVFALDEWTRGILMLLRWRMRIWQQ